MKLLFINTLYHPDIGGGAEIVLRRQAELLAARGHTVQILTIGDVPEPREEWVNGVLVLRQPYANLYYHHRREGIPSWKRSLWHLRDRFNRTMAQRARSVVDRFKPDVVSCHNLAGWSVSVWSMLKRLDVPTVQVLHDQYLLCIRSTMYKTERCQARCTECRLMRSGHPRRSTDVTAVLGVSRFIVDKLLSAGYFSGRRAEWQHNASAIQPLAEQASPRHPDGAIVFGFIGTLVPSKGIQQLIAAFTAVAPAHWVLMVAGGGDANYVADLKSSSRQDARIRFLGYAKPADFFAGIDICVVPSVWDDTFPGVVLEAQMFGRPVLGSCRGGIPETIAPDQSGALFDPDVEGDLGRVMVQMASEIGTWRERAQTIHQRMAATHGEAQWITALERFYQSIADVRQHT